MLWASKGHFIFYELIYDLFLPGRLEELIGRPRLHVFPVDLDVLVPVWPLVLGHKAKKMKQFVSHGAKGLKMIGLTLNG